MCWLHYEMIETFAHSPISFICSKTMQSLISTASLQSVHTANHHNGKRCTIAHAPILPIRRLLTHFPIRQREWHVAESDQCQGNHEKSQKKTDPHNWMHGGTLSALIIIERCIDGLGHWHQNAFPIIVWASLSAFGVRIPLDSPPIMHSDKWNLNLSTGFFPHDSNAIILQINNVHESRMHRIITI